MSSKQKQMPQPSADRLKREIEVKIIKGDMTAALHQLKEEYIQPDAISSILRVLCSLLSKAQKGEIDAPDYSIVTKLTQQCGTILGLHEKKFLASKDCIKNITVLFHHILYLFLKEKCFDDMLVLYPLIQHLSPMALLIVDQKEQKEAISSLKEMDKIYWNAVGKHSEEKMVLKFCCCSIGLLSSMEDCDLLALWQRLTRILQSYPTVIADTQNWQTLVCSVNLKSSHSELSLMEEEAVDMFLEVLLVKLFKKARKSDTSLDDFGVLECLVRQGLICKDKIGIAQASLKAVSSLASESCKQAISDCRRYASTENQKALLTQLLLNLCLEEDKKSWKGFPKTNVEFLIDLFELCLPSVCDSVIVDATSLFFKMLEYNLEPLTQGHWMDHKLPGIKLICSSMPKIKFTSVEENNHGTVVHCFSYLTYMIYQMLTAKYYYEAQKMLNLFMDHACPFLSSLIKDAKANEVKEMLGMSTTVFRNSIFLLTKPGGDEDEKNLQLLQTGLLVITAVSLSSNILTKEEHYQELSSTMASWCDMREKMSVAGQGTNDNIIKLWKKHKPFITEHFPCDMKTPDWEQIGAMEIFNYPENQECVALVLRAAKALESVTKQSEECDNWWYITLALAHARNQDEEQGPVVASLLATKVVSKLQADLAKEATKDAIIGLIHACYQQYICEQKKQRKDNEKLAEIPLLVRAPPKRKGPGGESTALEAWEEGQELSQLGQVLSCRTESRTINPLVQVVHYADMLSKQGVTKNETRNLTSTLHIVECTGYIFSTLGHYWLALKCWGLLYSLAQQAENTKSQLIAISMILARYSLGSDSDVEAWLLENAAKIKQELSADCSSAGDSAFIVHFYSLCYARALMLSNRKQQSASIVLDVLKETETSGYEKLELSVHARLLASQLLVSLPVSDPKRQELLEVVQGPMEAAQWSLATCLRIVSAKKPAERDLRNLRRQELMIDTGLWMARLATLTGCNKLACTSLQFIMQKLQNLMYPARVAQVLACLGDIDLMIPDKVQLDQRLYWNQKILSLGAAIEGKKEVKSQQNCSMDTSPTKFKRKDYQLTAFCSSRCSRTENMCILCKNPLYQLCKVHYAFLVEENETTFLEICAQLEAAYKEQVDRLWLFTWKKILPKNNVHNKASTEGWLPLLLAPISLLECRQRLAIAAVVAGNGNPKQAADDVLNIIGRLKSIQHETAPLLLRWAQAQLASCLMQIRGLGEFSSKLRALPQLPVIPSLSLFENADDSMDTLAVNPSTPVRTPSPTPSVTFKPGPKRPGRKPACQNPQPEPCTPIITSVYVPKLILPEETPSVSPETKTKMLFTSDNIEVTPKNKKSSRNVKGKENIDLFSPDSPPIYELTAKTAKKTSKGSRIVKNQTVGKQASPAPIFSIFCDTVPKQMSVKKYGSRSTATKASTYNSRTVKADKQLSTASGGSPMLKTSKCPPVSSVLSSSSEPIPSSDDSPVVVPKSSRRARVNIETSPDSPIVTNTVKTNRQKNISSDLNDTEELQMQSETTDRIDFVNPKQENKLANKKNCKSKPAVTQMKSQAIKAKSKIESPISKESSVTRPVKGEISHNISSSSTGFVSLGGVSLKSQKPVSRAKKQVQVKSKVAAPSKCVDSSMDSDVSILESSVIEMQSKRPTRTVSKQAI